MDTITLFIDEVAGIYIPRNFYENFEFSAWGLNVSDYADLSMPENEHYWEAWDDLLRDAKHTDSDGHEWSLYQDGSLFAVRDDHTWDEEQYHGRDKPNQNQRIVPMMSNTMKPILLQCVYAAGYHAAEQHKRRMPIYCPVFMSAIEGTEVGEGVQYSLAWMKGYQDCCDTEADKVLQADPAII